MTVLLTDTDIEWHISLASVSLATGVAGKLLHVLTPGLLAHPQRLHSLIATNALLASRPSLSGASQEPALALLLCSQIVTRYASTGMSHALVPLLPLLMCWLRPPCSLLTCPTLELASRQALVIPLMRLAALTSLSELLLLVLSSMPLSDPQSQGLLATILLELQLPSSSPIRALITSLSAQPALTPLLAPLLPST
jgi:hypothetical protein